ncbi:hypothetical protein BHM03_00062720, partial [Ensete ventricosum]
GRETGLDFCNWKMSRYHEDVDEMAEAYEMGDGEDDMDEELRGRGMGDSESDDEEYGQSDLVSRIAISVHTDVSSLAQYGTYRGISMVLHHSY